MRMSLAKVGAVNPAENYWNQPEPKNKLYTYRS